MDARRLPLDRFLNVVYYLSIRESSDEDRQRLDSDLGVSLWSGPLGRARLPVRVESGAPPWWGGDEEASQGFLAAMGMQLADGSSVG
jgi:hypothetical protein